MKKTKKTVLIAAAFAAAVGMTACGGESTSSNNSSKEIDNPPIAYDPSSEAPQEVYGPPPTMEIVNE